MKDYSQCGQQEQILSFFRTLKLDSGYFVDVGAFDGETYSNSLALELMGWDGICIEPLAANFAKLQGRRKCECVHAAIGLDEGDREIHYPTNPDSPAWMAVANIEGNTSPIWCNCNLLWEKEKTSVRHLRSILGHVKSCEFLTVDAEGMDLEVLLTFPFERLRPRLVVTEYTAGTIDRIECLMAAWNYESYGKTAQDAFFYC
jgi:FkbM family methyltransferase